MKIKILFLLTLAHITSETLIKDQKTRKLTGEQPSPDQQLGSVQYAHWNPNAYTTAFNPQVDHKIKTQATQYASYGLTDDHHNNMMANPMLNPMLMNPYQMGSGVMGMQPGMGQMMPGMAMYPFMNPYMANQGPYGSNSPYMENDARKLIIGNGEIDNK